MLGASWFKEYLIAKNMFRWSNPADLGEKR